MKFAPYQNMSIEATAPQPLIALSNDTFLLPSATGDNSGSDAFYRVFEFRNAGREGRMQHLGNGLRLYKRVEVT
jgi:hypothetical protein